MKARDFFLSSRGNYYTRLRWGRVSLAGFIATETRAKEKSDAGRLQYQRLRVERWN